MKNALFICFIFTNCYGQIQNEAEIFVPIEISYLGEKRIPWELNEYKDFWFKVMNYSYTNPHESRVLQSQNLNEFKKKNNQLLFTRKACDSLIKDYIKRATDHSKSIFKNRFVFGEGAYYAKEKSGDSASFRCVCLPAKMISELAHGEQPNYRGYTLYLEPKPFVSTFKRFKLDSLDWSDAPYFTIFPTDINPSFDCSKAITNAEKAICRNAQLAHLDSQMMMYYRQALKTKGTAIKDSQRVWVKDRDKACENKNNEQITDILLKIYQKRIQLLK